MSIATSLRKAARAAVVLAFCSGCPGLFGCKSAKGEGSLVVAKTEDEQALYALGFDMASNVQVFSLSPAELEIVEAGLSDAVSKRSSRYDVEKLRPKITQLAIKRRLARTRLERAAGERAVAQALQQPGARQLASGVVVRTLRPGQGRSPGATDRVKVNYEGRLLDGTVFDSSAQHGEPAEFHVQSVARCWIDGILAMKVGEKAELTCPANVAYGESGNPPSIPGGATLIFDIELLDSVAPPPAATVPAGSAVIAPTPPAHR